MKSRRAKFSPRPLPSPKLPNGRSSASPRARSAKPAASSPPALFPNYARFVQATFGDRARRLGWSAKPGENSDTALERASIVLFVASQGDDTALRDEARRLADEWLKTRQGIDANMVNPALTTAAQFGDRALFDTMAAELHKTTDRQQRGRLLGALGSFATPPSRAPHWTW